MDLVEHSLLVKNQLIQSALWYHDCSTEEKMNPKINEFFQVGSLILDRVVCAVWHGVS